MLFGTVAGINCRLKLYMMLTLTVPEKKNVLKCAPAFAAEHMREFQRSPGEARVGEPFIPC